ncbi:MAG: type II toxin-antitoxin system RelE/ParE family toxin [Flavobacteriales bacterium]|nr:type II toxin-antitoxin system RelE/ParE family toxin [Flavobacteriales bacterium]
MLVIKPEALEEIRQAHLWYEVQRPGLGAQFREELSECLQFIVENPPGFAVRKKVYRAAVLSRFPYVVWYAMEGADVVVYRVRHGKQKPLGRFWNK